jgi:hypothetical protein
MLVGRLLKHQIGSQTAHVTHAKSVCGLEAEVAMLLLQVCVRATRPESSQSKMLAPAAAASNQR